MDTHTCHLSLLSKIVLWSANFLNNWQCRWCSLCVKKWIVSETQIYFQTVSGQILSATTKEQTAWYCSFICFLSYLTHTFFMALSSDIYFLWVCGWLAPSPRRVGVTDPKSFSCSTFMGQLHLAPRLVPVWHGWLNHHSVQLQWNSQTSLPSTESAYNKAVSPGEETGMLKKHKCHGFGIKMLQQQHYINLLCCHNRWRVVSTVSKPWISPCMADMCHRQRIWC